LEKEEHLSVKKKVASLAIFTLLLLGMLSIAFNIKPAKSEWTGTVYIRADGSIDPPDAPIITYDNVTYTLTGNITSNADGIVVQRDNIIIDGAGYTLQGTKAYRSKGIDLTERSNVTIMNIRITIFTYGIYLKFSTSNSIIGNSITNTGTGIDPSGSSNNIIIRNNITNNVAGIWICIFNLGSSNNVIMGNDISANMGTGIYLPNSSNNSIIGNKITANKETGIHLATSSNSIIMGNDISANDGFGVHLFRSHNNSIIGNKIAANEGYGIFLIDSSKSIIMGNDISANYKYGIYLPGSSNNSIIGNNITNSWKGIYLHNSSNNSIIGNKIAANEDTGIDLLDSNNSVIMGNKITSNLHGISLSSLNDVIIRNVIMGNDISANDGFGVHLFRSHNNSIIGNNITNNGCGILLYAASHNFIYHNNFLTNRIQASTLSAWSVWDNGYPSGGNYWSDYFGVDANGDGIGDTPYIIDESNVDRYPLMKPCQIPIAPPPSKTYILHVQSYPITGIQISYCGDYSGTEMTNFEIGPKNSPFTITLTAPLTYQGYTFDHWELDGVNMGSDTALTVSANDMKRERTAVAVYSSPGVSPSYTINYLFSSMDVESNGVLHVYFQVLKHEVDGTVTPANGVPVKIQTSSGSMEKTSENYLNVDGIAHFSFSLPDYSGYCFSVYVEPSTFNGVPVYPPSVNPILWPVKPREALLHFSTAHSYEASLGVGVQGSLSQGFSLHQDGENLYGVSFSEEAKSGLKVDYHPFEARLGVAHVQVGGEAGGGVIAGLNYGVFAPSDDTQKSIVKYLIAKWLFSNVKVAAQSLPPAEKLNAQVIMMALNFVVQYELARLGADNYVCCSKLGGYGYASVEAEASVGLSSEKGSAKNTIGKIGSVGVSHESEIAVSLVNYGDGEIGVRGEASYNVQVGAGVDLNMGFLKLSAGTTLVDAVLTIGAEIIYKNQQPSTLNVDFSIEGSRASFESLSFYGLISALSGLKIPSTFTHGKLTLILSMPMDRLSTKLAKYVKDLVFGEINLTQLLNEVYDEIANTPIQYEVRASFEGVNKPVNIGLKICGVGLGYGWEYQEYPEVVLEKGFIWNRQKWTIVQYDSIPKSMNTLQFLKDYLPTISGIVIQLNEKAKHLYLHVYDNQGRHVGLNYETGRVETEIPDSYYFDNKNGTIAIVLPLNLTDFRVEVDGRYAMETTEKYNLTTVVLSADRANYTQISASITKGETQVYNVAIPPTGPPTITKSENPWWVQHTLWIITGVIVTAAALTVSTALIKKRKAYRSQSVTKNKVNT
jgi:parallel beta-helix repeat protein